MMSPMLAALPIAAQAQTAAPASTPAPAKDKKVCRQMEAETGSHFPGKRVCHSRNEWAAIDSANAEGAGALSRQVSRSSALNQ